MALHTRALRCVDRQEQSPTLARPCYLKRPCSTIYQSITSPINATYVGSPYYYYYYYLIHERHVCRVAAEAGLAHEQRISGGVGDQPRLGEGFVVVG